jgi:hypothetical protein
MRILAAAVLLAALAPAQKLDIQLDHLKAKAAESSAIDVDRAAIDLLARKWAPGLKSVYIRSFEFENEGDYTAADVDSILKQVRGDPAWSRLLTVREKRERVDIHVMNKNGVVQGFLFVAAEPRELTVIHIVGSLTLDQARHLVDHHLDL